MNSQQYAWLVLQLSAIAQSPIAYRTLDDDEVENIRFLLEQAHNAAQVEQVRRQEERKSQQA